MKSLVVEKSVVGIPYEPIGKTLENDSCSSDEKEDSDIESHAGGPKSIDFNLPSSV